MIAFLTIAVAWLVTAEAISRRRNAAAASHGVAEIHRRGVDGSTGGRMPILMPVCGRPDYLRKVVEALSKVHGIERALIVVSQDGRDPEVSAIISQMSFAEVVVLRHARPYLGTLVFFWDSLHAIGRHTRFLLDFAFNHLGAEHAIVLEDDILPSPDFLRFFSWAREHVMTDHGVMTVTGFNLHSRVDGETSFDPRRHPHDLVENRDAAGQPEFTSWGWCMSRAMWGRVRRHWSDWSWDEGLTKTQRRLGLKSYKPVLARVKNIGMQGGINFTESEGNPRWLDLVLADGPYEGAPPPRIFDRDLDTPRYEDVTAADPVPNERQRTRSRRLGLVALIAAMALLEALAWGALRP